MVKNRGFFIENYLKFRKTANGRFLLYSAKVLTILLFCGKLPHSELERIAG